MTMIQSYLDIVQKKLNDITQQQSHKITSTAVELAKIINQGGVIYIFGCGTHIFSLKMYFIVPEVSPRFGQYLSNL